MIFEKLEELSLSLQQKALSSWNTEYPEVLQHNEQSFQDYLQSLDNLQHTVVTDDAQNFCAWYFEFDRDNERQFGIVVQHEFQNRGLGSQLLRHAKKQNEILFAWVVDSNKYKKQDGSNYISPINFYLKNGFSKESARWDSEKIRTVKISWHKK